MATVDSTFDYARPIETAAAPARAPTWPQFSLRRMLIGVAAVSMLLAAAQTLGVGGTLLMAFGLLLVFFHVLGNSLGTRLRDSAKTDLDHVGGELPGPAQRPAVTRSATLYGSAALGRPMSIVTRCGAIGGAALAGLLLAGKFSLPGVLVAMFSAGILGGFLGFMTSSFLQVSLGLIAEANVAHRAKPRPPAPPRGEHR